MKRSLLLFVAIAFCFVACANEGAATNDKAVITADGYSHTMASPRYKLYKTENYWNFLELDTRTGAVWQVQFVVNDTNRFKTKIVWSLLDSGVSESTAPDGRFELYPTTNRYNFLLVDQTTGRVWQIQWAIDDESLQGIVAEIK